MDRMLPNTSDAATVSTLPFALGRSSSISLPRATASSCWRAAEKLPKTAAVMAEERWSVRA
eukprot:scaffold214409_cov33-Tisochrysis_lutea.AAC.1